MNRIYLDHSATTPTDQRVIDAMLPYFTDIYGNAASSHTYGNQAEKAIQNARETIAGILNCSANEIIFTSGGTEANNLALRGAAWLYPQSHIISTQTEHEATLRTIEQLDELQGFSYTLLNVDKQGRCSRDLLKANITDRTSIISIAYANNEVGTIQPIRELSRCERPAHTLFHTDAVQAGGQLSLDTEALNVDLMTLSAHKFYGPKGIGVLYIRDGVHLIPYLTGGKHENNRRAGTQNTPLIVGLAKALEIAYEEREDHIKHMQNMRDALIDGVLHTISDAYLTGHPVERLPSHASFVISGVDSNRLLMHLDMKGIAASSGSACKTGNAEPSSVLLALGYDEAQALGSLRLTVGRQTTAEDIDYTVTTLAESITRLRKIRV